MHGQGDSVVGGPVVGSSEVVQKEQLESTLPPQKQRSTVFPTVTLKNPRACPP